MQDNKTEIEINVKATIIQDGNKRKIGFIEYNHGESKGYDLLQVLTTVLAETLIRSRSKHQMSDEDWLDGVVDFQAKALRGTMLLRMTQKEIEQ